MEIIFIKPGAHERGQRTSLEKEINERNVFHGNGDISFSDAVYLKKKPVRVEMISDKRINRR